LKNKILKGIYNPKKAYNFIYNWTNYNSGKIFFKNAAGFKNNLSGVRTKNKYQQEDFKIKESLIPKINELKTRGILPLGKFFDDALINRIMKKYNNMIEDDQFSLIRGKNINTVTYDGPIFSRQLLMAYKNLPEINELLTDDIKEMVEAYYQSNFKVMHLMCWRTYHVPKNPLNEKEVYSEHWHCDGKDTSILKLFVNLTDVTEDYGPFLIQPLERTKELIHLGFGDRHQYKLSDKVLEDPKHLIKAVGPAGTALLCNTQFCLHRASIPKEGRIRDIMQIQFIPSKHPLKEDWPNEIKAIDEELQKQRIDPSLT